MRINDKRGLSTLETDSEPKHTIVVAESGAGKTMGSETLLYNYYINGYTIISITDTKDKIELGFTQFPPEQFYHEKFNKKYGVPITSIPTEIYHPFTFQLPDYPIPPMNIYTIPINNITRTQLQFIAETDQETTSIRILNQATQNAKPNEGIHHILYQLEEKTEKKKGNLRSLNPDSFFTKGSEGGTQKNITDIISYFKPFLNDYFITPNQSPHNLNIQKVMNNQKKYHIFTTKYLKDPKLKSLIINILIEQIIENLEYAKHPICIYIEEIRQLAPDKSEGYTKLLSDTIKRLLIQSRNMGKGVATISTTQSYWEINKDIRTSINQQYIGKMTSLQEMEKTAKALRLKSTEIDTLKSLRIGQYVCNNINDYDDYNEVIKLFLPPHRHAEIGYSYEETYKNEYQQKQQEQEQETQQPTTKPTIITPPPIAGKLIRNLLINMLSECDEATLNNKWEPFSYYQAIQTASKFLKIPIPNQEAKNILYAQHKKNITEVNKDKIRTTTYQLKTIIDQDRNLINQLIQELEIEQENEPEIITPLFNKQTIGALNYVFEE